MAKQLLSEVLKKDYKKEGEKFKNPEQKNYMAEKSNTKRKKLLWKGRKKIKQKHTKNSTYTLPNKPTHTTEKQPHTPSLPIELTIQ